MTHNFFLYNPLAYERQEHFTTTIFVCSGYSNFFDCWYVVIIVLGECYVHRKPVWFEILAVTCGVVLCTLKKTAQICTLSTLFKTWMHKLRMHYNQQLPLYWPISVFFLFTCPLSVSLYWSYFLRSLLQPLSQFCQLWNNQLNVNRKSCPQSGSTVC